MQKGKIIKHLGGFYYIDTGSEVIESRAKGNFRHLKYTPVVGDIVYFKYESNSTLGYIEKIYPRKNILLRPPVSNIDQVIVLVPVKKPKYNLYLIDKVIALYEGQDLDIVILINKSDLDPDIANYLYSIYENAGFKTLQLSLEYLEESSKNLIIKLISNKTTALSGVSGAGKSTLSNAILHLDLETASVSKKTDRGRHTTRHSEIFKGPSNSYLLDTPGFSSIDMKDITEEELPHRFREFFKYLDKCKFNNCLHENEPQCAVKQAVEDGKISKERYENYLMILKDVRNNRRF